MTYLLTFCMGFVLGYLAEGFRDMITDRRIDEDDDDEVYVSITEKGKQWLEEHSDNQPKQ